jgi:hypothetical protein
MPSPNFNPGHSHDGLLGVEVYWRGVSFITELGSSTYDPNSRRTLERSSKAHSTFSNQDCGHFNLYKSFRLGKLPDNLEFERSNSTMKAILIDSYGIQSSRQISFSLSGFTITDSIKNSETTARMTGRFIINSMWKVLSQDSKNIIFIYNSKRIRLSFSENIVMESLSADISHSSPSRALPVLVFKYHSVTNNDSIFNFEEITDYN